MKPSPGHYLTAAAALVFAVVAGVTGCSHRAIVTSVSRTRIVVDERYDAIPSPAAQAFIEPYRQHIDSMMSPVVGMAARTLDACRPESPLSNLLADILVWAGEAYYGERPDMAVYNIGGIRASLPAGDITLGDVIDVAPFNNKICFLTLSGTRLGELLAQIAAAGGEGVSHGVRMSIDGSNGTLLTATLNGEEIDPQKAYRIATLDYLAQGNDGLTAFKSATAISTPDDDGSNVRHIIIRYMRELRDKGQCVDAEIEGRIRIAQ